MSWKTVLVVLVALVIGFGVLARIATRGGEPAPVPAEDPTRITAPG
ncbi:hypothetical protein [Pseudohaliea rubra]|uniref:Uncharacterized protein n=1 Tax=Pseudohaliea rubra DSM 19751 TaxID=1265313 RepID=A0A095VSC9_9GAMM|nr:hypothetical protein [Pseudohaliea rubra]KGE04270.1 hypothetical protein HRUBRA_01134 [Pseudohaliea rubra DSM 19751]